MEGERHLDAALSSDNFLENSILRTFISCHTPVIPASGERQGLAPGGHGLGYPCALKYEAGWRTEPRWRECHRLLSARAEDPDAEHRRLTQILAATWLIGHSDLHRRNLGFLHAEVGPTASITIAPLYVLAAA